MARITTFLLGKRFRERKGHGRYIKDESGMIVVVSGVRTDRFGKDLIAVMLKQSEDSKPITHVQGYPKSEEHLQIMIRLVIGNVNTLLNQNILLK